MAADTVNTMPQKTIDAYRRLGHPEARLERHMADAADAGESFERLGVDLDAVADVLFNREEQNRLEDALPRVKGLLQASYVYNRFSAMGRANYFGGVEYKPTNPDNDESFGAKTLFDIDLGYEILRGMRLSVGANNMFNTFPDEHEKSSNRSNGRFPYSRRVTQFGMNGGFYYGRIQLTL